MKWTIEIEVPDGKKAVWKDGKVVFEDILPELPKTWEEFCKKYSKVKQEYFIDYGSNCINTGNHYTRNSSVDKHLLPTKEAAEAHLALMQLHQLRDCYRQGWVPDWKNSNQYKHYITKYSNDFIIVENTKTHIHFLAFQTSELALEFLRNFKPLIQKAEDLIN